MSTIVAGASTMTWLDIFLDHVGFSNVNHIKAEPWPRPAMAFEQETVQKEWVLRCFVVASAENFLNNNQKRSTKKKQIYFPVDFHFWNFNVDPKVYLFMMTIDHSNILFGERFFSSWRKKMAEDMASVFCLNHWLYDTVNPHKPTAVLSFLNWFRVQL